MKRIKIADASHKVPTVSASCPGMDSSAFPVTNVQETPSQPQMDTTQSLPGGSFLAPRLDI